jgi:hypothetical protein
MSLNKLTDIARGKELGLQIGCTLIESTTVICETITMPVGGDITVDDIVVGENLTVNGNIASIGGVNFKASNNPMAAQVLRTDGLGGTYWSDTTPAGTTESLQEGFNVSTEPQIVMTDTVDKQTLDLRQGGVNTNLLQLTNTGGTANIKLNADGLIENKSTVLNNADNHIEIQNGSGVKKWRIKSDAADDDILKITDLSDITRLSVHKFGEVCITDLKVTNMNMDDNYFLTTFAGSEGQVLTYNSVEGVAEWNDSAGGGETLQETYDLSTTPQIVSTATNKQLVVQQGAGLTDPPVFAVKNVSGDDRAVISTDGILTLAGANSSVELANNLNVKKWDVKNDSAADDFQIRSAGGDPKLMITQSGITTVRNLQIGSAGAEYKMTSARGQLGDVLTYNTNIDIGEWTAPATTSLQNAYDNSTSPQITTANNYIKVKQGGGVPVNPVIAIENVAGAFESIILNADGDIKAESLSIREAGAPKWSVSNGASNALEISSATGGIVQSINSAGGAQWSSGGNAIMSINSSGHLGLGDSIPATLPAGQLSLFNDNSTNDQLSIYTSSGSPILDFKKCNTSVSTPSEVVINDNVGAVRYKGWSGIKYDTGAQLAVRASENWTSTTHGCNFVFRSTATGTDDLVDRWRLNGDGSNDICNANGSVCLTVENDGRLIVGNRADPNTLEYTLPHSRGLLDQILQSDANGVLGWVTPFKHYHYNYQTIIDSLTVYHSPTPSIIITDGGAETKVLVAETGNYMVDFSAELSLNGNLPQTCASQITNAITELKTHPYVNFAPADWGAGTILTAGFHKHTGASGLSTTLTLSGSATDTFVLWTIGALTTGAGSSVILSGGVLAKNVFWIVDGALTLGATGSVMKGVLLVRDACTFNDSASVEGRLYMADIGAPSIGSFLNNSNINIATPDTSDLIVFGAPLSNYGIFNSNGNLTRTGSSQINHMPLLTGAGVVSGFGAPYDGTYTFGTVQPTIWVNVMLFNNGILEPTSMRCIKMPVSDCHCVSFSCDMSVVGGNYIDARILVRISDTSSTVRIRCLNLTRIIN